MTGEDYAVIVGRVRRGEEPGFLSDSQGLTVALSLGRLGRDDLAGLAPREAWARLDGGQRDAVRALNGDVAAGLSIAG